MTYEGFSIPTYVFNLLHREDRRKHIEAQFADKPEFELRWGMTCTHQIGAVGLWQSICKAVTDAEERGEDDVIILCEDDHFFTEHYDRGRFIEQIIKAGKLGTHLLAGGIANFTNAILLKDMGLFWVDWLWCTQFIALFRPAFRRILEADFADTDVADEFLSKILPNKLVVHPFISEQKEFGYSDITKVNEQVDFLPSLFRKASEELANYQRITQKYSL